MDEQQRAREALVRRTIVRVAWLNVGLVMFEFGSALRTEALSLLADAVHNITDVAALVLVGVGWSISGRPASARWPRGKAGAEDVAQLGLGAMIAATGVYVAYEAITAHVTAPRDLSWVIATSLVVTAGNAWAARRLRVVGRRTRAGLLVKAGDHALGDTAASLVPGLSAGLAYMGAPVWVEAVAAFVISLWIFHLAWETTVDAARRVLSVQDHDAAANAIEAAMEAADVLTVLRAHARWIGSRRLELSVIVYATEAAAPEQARREIVERFAAAEPFVQVTVAVRACAEQIVQHLAPGRRG